MKVFLCTLILCFIASSLGAVKNLGDECKSEDKCPDNAECKAKNMFCKTPMMCHCKEKYLKKDTKCLKIVGESCENNADCYTNLCTSKKCACETGKTWSKNKMGCVAGGVYMSACSDNSKCLEESGTNLECKNTKCECKADYENKNDHDDLCSKMKMKKKYDETCTNDDECDSKYLNLKCSSPKCGCKDGDKAKDVHFTDDMGKVMTAKKCLNENATIDEAEGEECLTMDGNYPNFSEDAKYCAKGLWCGMCESGGKNKCIKKVETTGGAGQVSFGLFVAIGCFTLRKFIM